MFNLKNLMHSALLALALAASAGGAIAGPTYHVDINTNAFSGTNGYFDFYFSRDGGAPNSTVTMTNFSGALGADEQKMGDVTGSLPGTVLFGSTDGFNDLFRAAALGGAFGFDLTFGGDFLVTTSGITSLFGVALYADDQISQLVSGDLVQFGLVPMSANGPSGVTVAANADFAQAAAVPEPSDLLLMMSGLALMGWVVRRKAGAAR